MNTEGITAEYANGRTPIGLLRNTWRHRFVEVYPHADENKVVTIGRCMMPRNHTPIPAPVVCVENKEDWARVIAKYPNIAVYD